MQSYLHLLQHSNHAGVLRLTNGQLVNYGSIRVQNEYAIYWTGKGLREVWPQIPNEEQKKLAATLQEKFDNGREKELIVSGHIAVTPLIEIQIVVS